MHAPNESRSGVYRVDSSSNPLNDSDRDLYTIPSGSSWFSWDDIHQRERIALSEFVSNSSVSKTPKIYKEYRDFIINKYREDPSRRLTFSEVRKCLIGDVGSLHKVFRFLEKFGLINFGLQPSDDGRNLAAAEANRFNIVVEESAPSGIRVAEFPNSTKILTAVKKEAALGRGCEVLADGGVWLPSLTSYSDVFGELGRDKKCCNCEADCISDFYESRKQEGFALCAKCFKDESYGEVRHLDDYKFVGSDGSGSLGSDLWTDAEISLLLDSVSNHGDDWNLVEQHVRTKTKRDCISKLLQMPFGKKLLHSNIKGDDLNSNDVVRNLKQIENPLADEPFEEAPGTDNQDPESIVNEPASIEINDDDVSVPTRKRIRMTSPLYAGYSLMKQVACLSTVVGPHVAAEAAEAAVASLCNENPCAREFFEAENIVNDLELHSLNNAMTGVFSSVDSEMAKQGKNDKLESAMKENGPSTSQVRVAIASAFGAAAGHAKLLAVQEEREMEHLMATIIQAQPRKIECKIKHFEVLESIMEKEYSLIQQLKDSTLSNQINVIKQAICAGIPIWKDHSSKQTLTISSL